MLLFNSLLVLSLILLCLPKISEEKEAFKEWKYLRKSPLSGVLPLVMTTWAFTGATQAAWDTLSLRNGSAIDAVLEGCTYCEKMQCDFTVGFGGSPDENGETTLDAMIIDGNTLNIGAVGGLRRIKNAIGVAKKVLLHSEHTILIGDAATNFAKDMGFAEEPLSTNRSTEIWQNWLKNNCQPNFWKNVIPDCKTSCGPYRLEIGQDSSASEQLNPTAAPTDSNGFHHDTIGLIAMDSTGSIAAGLSSNGALHKIPGRMGDASIPGAGGFADSLVGAAAATGDGDVMMRFSPTSQIVEKMRNNVSPQKATRQVIKRIREKFPAFKGGLLAFNKFGEFGAACNGVGKFPFTVARRDIGGVRTYYVKCVDSGN